MISGGEIAISGTYGSPGTPVGVVLDGGTANAHGVDGQPACDVSVVVTRRAGGSVDWMRTDADGRYDLPVPKEGTYVLTALDRGTGDITTRMLTVGGGTVRADLQLTAGASPTSAGQGPTVG